MKKWLSTYEGNKEKKNQLQNQLQLLGNEIKQLKLRLTENDETIQTLFKFINVNNESDYYQHYEQYQQYQQNLARFNDLTTYLEKSSLLL